MHNFILIGPMGAGKSTIGRLLAKELRLPFKDSDKEIEQRTGASIPLIFDVEGEAGFRERERAVIAVPLAGRDGCQHRGRTLTTWRCIPFGRVPAFVRFFSWREKKCLTSGSPRAILGL